LNKELHLQEEVQTNLQLSRHTDEWDS